MTQVCFRLTRLTVGLATAVAAVIGMTAATAGAAAPPHAPGRSVDEVKDFVRAHGAPVESLEGNVGAEGRTAASATSSCHDSDWADARYDSYALDVTAYGLSSDCSNWILVAATSDDWFADELDIFTMDLDADNNASTGCDGSDLFAGVMYDNEYGELWGAMVMTPSCDDTTWSTVGEISASKSYSNTIALGFPSWMINNDRSFSWYLGLASIYGDVDFAPDSTWNTVRPPATAPSAPRALTAVRGNSSVKLQWSAPASNGGAGITDYIVQRSTDGTTWTTINDGISTSRATTVTGLTNGRRYTFRVAAKNGVGRGPWSATASAVPATTPSAPRRLVAERARGAIRLSWRAPVSTGGLPITDYVIQRSGNAGRTWRTVNDGVSTARGRTVGGLISGKRYTFRVAAKNRVGRGPWSPTVTGTPR